MCELSEADLEPAWWVRLSYWLRPYDSHLDRRRWRWTKSGCSQSREWWARNGHHLVGDTSRALDPSWDCVEGAGDIPVDPAFTGKWTKLPGRPDGDGPDV